MFVSCKPNLRYEMNVMEGRGTLKYGNFREMKEKMWQRPEFGTVEGYNFTILGDLKVGLGPKSRSSLGGPFHPWPVQSWLLGLLLEICFIPGLGNRTRPLHVGQYAGSELAEKRALTYAYNLPRITIPPSTVGSWWADSNKPLACMNNSDRTIGVSGMYGSGSLGLLTVYRPPY